MQEKHSIKIVLEDGTEIKGKAFGAKKSISGEVVFSTAMTGYPESLTDPSYKGQILVLTYPLIGNYGVPSDQIEDDLHAFHESDKIHISGLVVSDYTENHSHWNADRSLGDWLAQYDIPGIYDVDTRAITKKLREKGTMLGKIVVGNQDVEWYDPGKNNQVAQVSIDEKKVYGKGKKKILLVDCGVKFNIIRNFLDRDATVIRVPYDYNFLEEDYDGLFISNGPGNPKMCEKTIEHLKIALGENKPIFGICLGNQLLALAAGANSYKLKYGHRSHNQPVLKVGTNAAYVTSQNHGYAIDNETLPSEWSPLFVNVNDDTNEGMKHDSKPFFSVQFHPEAAGGPVDTEFLFDDFMELV